MASSFIQGKHGVWGAIAAIVTLPISFFPAHATFQSLDTKAKTPCHHQLTRIPNISYQCWQFEDPDAILPVWKYSLGFEFGQLTQAQWETIAIAYASWRTSDSVLEKDVLPSYDPEKHYWLMDFMPPIMQATNRHRFISQTTTQSEQPSASIIANCWGTLYEILRLRQASPDHQSYLMMVDPHTILSTLETLSSPVESPEPGDMILISHPYTDHQSAQDTAVSESTPSDHTTKTHLDHAALVIDKGLVFEKAGAGNTVPYRIIGLSTIQRIWRTDVFDHQIRRPLPNPEIPYPLSFSVEKLIAPMTIISDNDSRNPSQQYYSIFRLPPLIESGGRSKLPPQLFEPDYYKKSLHRSAWLDLQILGAEAGR